MASKATNEKDVHDWWDYELNISTRQHGIDPNRLEDVDSLEICKRDYDQLGSPEKHLVRIGYAFRHQNEDSTKTIGYDLSATAWNWWNTFNTSMRQHMLDPHQIFDWSLDLCKKRYEDLIPSERRIVDESFNVRHKEDSGGKPGQPIRQLKGSATKTSCQCMAEDVLSKKIPHYHAAYESPSIERMDNYKGRKGFFIKKFLINDKNNLNNWSVTWDAIKRDVWDFVGKPLVLTPDQDHPPVSKQEDYRVGDIIDVGTDDVNHSAWQVSEVFDKKAQKMIEDGDVAYGSPTVIMLSEATREKQSAGTPYQRDILHRFIPAHDAIVGNPAYGREVNRIRAMCTGDGPACAMKLLTVSASVEYRKMKGQNDYSENLFLPGAVGGGTGVFDRPLTYKEAEYVKTSVPRQCNTCVFFSSPNTCLKPISGPVDPVEGCCRYWKPANPNAGDILYIADIGADNTSQLTIVPFVRAELKKRFTAESLAAIVGHIREAESQDSCLSRKIRIISDEHPSWEHDKVIAVAYSYCGERGDSKEGDVQDIQRLFIPLASDLIKLTRDEQIRKKRDLMEQISRLQSEFKIMLEPN